MMNEDEIEKLAQLLYDRIMEKQEEADHRICRTNTKAI